MPDTEMWNWEFGIRSGFQIPGRAERLNQGDGRVYTIWIDATDAAGGTASRTVSVRVPR
jgi:hypothetical protein